MKTHPPTTRFDLVVVAHTDPQVLEATLRSIATQTSPAFIVVVDIGDGGNHAAGAAACLTHLRETGRCLWIDLPGWNRFAAINRGIAACTGQYLMVLHEGDKLADPHVLADCDKLIAHHGEPDVIYGERIKYIGDHWYHKKPRRHDQVALGMFVELSCMLVKRARCADVAFDDSYQQAGDYAFVCQLMREHPQATWLAINRVVTCVVLDKLHEGDLATKLQEDWRVQRRWVQSGLMVRTSVFMTRLISQLLRRLSRLTLGHPGFQTGKVPMNSDGRVMF